MKIIYWNNDQPTATLVKPKCVYMCELLTS